MLTMEDTHAAACRAIAARRAGEWDQPDLVAFGPLLPDVEADVLAIKRQWLQAEGFTVGARDPRLNTRYPGAFMVAEEYEASQLPTEDGSNGPFCIVGDDLDKLIAEAFDAQA